MCYRTKISWYICPTCFYMWVYSSGNNEGQVMVPKIKSGEKQLVPLSLPSSPSGITESQAWKENLFFSFFLKYLPQMLLQDSKPLTPGCSSIKIRLQKKKKAFILEQNLNQQSALYTLPSSVPHRYLLRTVTPLPLWTTHQEGAARRKAQALQHVEGPNALVKSPPSNSWSATGWNTKLIVSTHWAPHSSKQSHQLKQCGCPCSDILHY